MRPPRILVTRPAAEAQQWVAQLQAQGITAIALPLIEIGAYAPAQQSLALVHNNCAQSGHYRAVMFVSGNAVRYFFQPPGSIALAAPTRAWSPGPGTTQALQAAGIAAQQIDSPTADAAQFDSEALWSKVQTQIHAGDKVLIVRGSTVQAGCRAPCCRGQGREWLAEQLRQAGCAIDYLAVYERRAAPLTASCETLARAAARDGSLWLLSSAQAVANLQQALPDMDWRLARSLTTHPRIAAAARNAGFGLVLECRPALDDVLASIESSHEL